MEPMFYSRIVVINLLSCAIFSGCIFLYYHYPLHLLLTHLTLCVGIVFASVGSALLVQIVSSARIRRFSQSLIFSSATGFLLFVYLGDWFSNYFWKENLNINLISRILGHYYQLRKLETVLVSMAFLLVFFGIVFSAYLKIHKKYYSEVGKPIFSGFITLALSTLLVVQLYSSLSSMEDSKLKKYFYGELILDLFNGYKGARVDYLADGDLDTPDLSFDRVKTPLAYIEQRSDTIQAAKKNVVMVVVDALRADNLGSYNYHRNTTPFVDDLVAVNNGVAVDNFFSMCDESKCGTSSILTSRKFDHQNSAQASKYSLHHQLKRKGYQVNFLMSADQSFAGKKNIYFPNDFYLDGLGFKAHNFNDDRGVVSFLEGWPNYNGSPNFFYFHLFSVHEAGIEYGKYLGEAVSGIEPGFLVDNPIEPRFATLKENSRKKAITNQDNQDNKTFQVDLILSRIFALLSSKGYMDNTLVVITSDHGQGMGEHGYHGHISGLYNESLRVPLIMLDTSGDGALNLAETKVGSQLDVAPTVLRHLGKAVPETWSGQALQDKKVGPQITQHVIPNRSASFAKILYNPEDGSLYKYIFLSTLAGMKEERFFYDLIKDPSEQRNLLDSVEGRGQYLELIERWGLSVADK